MSESVSVFISGSVFSLLFYDNVKSEYNQDGLLFGEVISKEISKLTDASQTLVNKEHMVRVTSVLPCPHQFFLYNPDGTINETRLKELLNGRENNIVGWYIFKPNSCSSLRFNLRERIIHRELGRLSNVPINHFLCYSATLEKSHSKSTHSFKHTFIRFNYNYESLPVHIGKLSDFSYNFKTSECSIHVLNDIMKSIEDAEDVHPDVLTEQIENEIEASMKKLIKNSVKKEQKLFKLEQEVKLLQDTLKIKHDDMFEKNDDSSMDEVLENGTVDEHQVESLGPQKKELQSTISINADDCDSPKDVLKKTEGVMQRPEKARRGRGIRVNANK